MPSDERDICTLRGFVINRLGGIGNLDLPDRKIIRDIVEEHKRNHGGYEGDWLDSDPVVRALQEYGFQEVGRPSLAGRLGLIADCYEGWGRVRTARQLRRGFLRRHRC